MLLLVFIGWTAGILFVASRGERFEKPGSLAPRLLLLAILLTAMAVYFRYLLPLTDLAEAFPIDDSYITLTAARNLAERNLPAINPQAPLAGITSPLHVLLVGLTGKAVGVMTADRAWGLVAFLLTVAGLFHWVRQLGGGLPAAAGAAVGAILAGPLVFGALNGLETDLFAAIIVGSFVVYEKSRTERRWLVALGGLCGLAILTRPEGYFLTGVLFAARAAESWRGQSRHEWPWLGGGLLAAALLVLPYLLANYLLLDHVLPLTVSAKRHFFTSDCESGAKQWRTLASSPRALLGSAILMTPLLLLARRWWARIYPPLFLLAFYGAYRLEFTAALKHYNGRYQHPLLPVVYAGLALGGAAGIAWVAKKSARSGRWAGALLLASFLFLSFLNGGKFLIHYRLAIQSMAFDGYLMSVVNYAKEHTAPGDLIAAHDIGALYYYADRPILDLVGLTDPEVAQLFATVPSTCQGRNPRAVSLYGLLRRRQPRLLLFFPKWDRFLGLLREDRGDHLRYLTQLKKAFWQGEEYVDEREFAVYRGDWNEPAAAAAP